MTSLNWSDLKENTTKQTKLNGRGYYSNPVITPSRLVLSNSLVVQTVQLPTTDKECRDIIKLYKMMAKVIKEYPAHIKKIFYMRYFGKSFFFFENISTNCTILKIDNYIYFEKLAEHNGTMFRVQHLAVAVPTTVRLLVKFVLTRSIKLFILTNLNILTM